MEVLVEKGPSLVFLVRLMAPLLLLSILKKQIGLTPVVTRMLFRHGETVGNLINPIFVGYLNFSFKFIYLEALIYQVKNQQKFMLN